MKADLLNVKTWTTHLSETTAAFKAAVLGYMPNLVGAVIVLIVGLILAKIFKFIGTKIGQLIFKFLTAIEKKYHISGYKARKNYAFILGHILYWIVLIYFIFFALRVLNIPGVKAWISHFTSLIPNVLGALVIIYIGFLLGALAKNLVYSGKKTPSGEDHYFLSQTLRFGIITLFTIWGVGQLGFNVLVLTNFINIIIAAIFGAAALGFGLGSSAHVANMIGAFNFKKSFQIGDKMSIDNNNGTIVDISSNAITLETSEGLIIIPAKKTLDTICHKGS